MIAITQQFKNLSFLAVVVKTVAIQQGQIMTHTDCLGSSYQAPLSLIPSDIQITALNKILNL